MASDLKIIPMIRDFMRKSEYELIDRYVICDGKKHPCAIKGFADKVANGIAPFIVGTLIDIGGFDGALEVQSAATQNVIILVNSLVPAIVGLIGFVTILMCKMEKDIKEMETARLAE